MLRVVKLVQGAQDKAREAGLAVGFLTDPNQVGQARDAEGNEIDYNAGPEVQVKNREYHLLQQHGLIEEGSARLLFPAADQDVVEREQERGKLAQFDATAAQRLGVGLPGAMPSKFPQGKNPGGTVTPERYLPETTRDTAADRGGAGHLKDDGYSNRERVQGEIRLDQGRGAAARAESGDGPVADEYRGLTYDEDGNEVTAADLRARAAERNAELAREAQEAAGEQTKTAEQQAREAKEAAEKDRKDREKAEREREDRELAEAERNAKTDDEKAEVKARREALERKRGERREDKDKAKADEKQDREAKAKNESDKGKQSTPRRRQ